MFHKVGAWTINPCGGFVPCNFMAEKICMPDRVKVKIMLDLRCAPRALRLGRTSVSSFFIMEALVYTSFHKSRESSPWACPGLLSFWGSHTRHSWYFGVWFSLHGPSEMSGAYIGAQEQVGNVRARMPSPCFLPWPFCWVWVGVQPLEFSRSCDALLPLHKLPSFYALQFLWSDLGITKY